MNLVKGALKMKQGYNSYKKCECLDQDMTNMWNNKHFQGAINLGCGCFNIVSYFSGHNKKQNKKDKSKVLLVCIIIKRHLFELSSYSCHK